MPDIACPSSHETLDTLWQDAGLPPAGIRQVDLGDDTGPVLPSSFAVATAAQSSLAGAALAAAELWHLRHPELPRQQLQVDRRHAVLEFSGFFRVDGRAPTVWEKYSGLYRCGGTAPAPEPGWCRIHANFDHHRDGALRLLGLPAGNEVAREAVDHALQRWSAEGFEQAAADAGLVVAAARSFDQWDAHPAGRALAAEPLLAVDRIGDAPPCRWPTATPDQPPLHGLRVLDLTRILAGPIAGRCLAAYGADVMLVNSPRLPNIPAIADTSRGKLSCHIDLQDSGGRSRLDALTAGAHVFLQGYRPGSLAARGYGAERLTRLRPGIVVAELSSYGWTGPWAGRRGFDSLVQTATGLNLAEAEALGSTQPRALPLPILDYGAAHLLALGIQTALWRQATQGGSWRVRVSLAGVASWLRSLGRPPDGLSAEAHSAADFAAYSELSDSGFGRLCALRHAARFSRTPARWSRPAMPPGSHAAAWPGDAA